MSSGSAATPALLEDKLETAQKLSQLLAAHNQQQQQNDANKARRAAAKAEKREAIKAGRVASGMSKDDSYRPGVQSNSSRRRGAGKVKAPTSPLCLVAPPSMRRAAPRDAAGNGSPAVEQQRTQTVKLEQLNSVAELSTEDVLMGVARLERRHKALLEQLRAELGLDAAPRASSNSSTDTAAYYHAIPTQLWEDLQRFRGPLTRATRALVLRDLELAERKKLAHRLWMAFYKELDAVQQALKRLAADSKEQHPTAAAAKPAALTPQTSPDALRAL
eukprot:7504-Heterococcus_DN1.PRE.1